MNNKILCYLSISIAAYFILLVANVYWLNIQAVWVGVVQEMLTLPLFAVQLVIAILSFVQLVKNRFQVKSYAFCTFLVAAANTLAAIASILFANLL